MALLDNTVDLGMWDRTRTRWNEMREMDVLAGQTIAEEGSCLVLVGSGSSAFVRDATGTAADVWYGMSVKDTRAILTDAAKETLTVPAAGTYTLTLSRSNLVGSFAATSVYVYDNTAVAALAEKAALPAASGQYVVNYTTGVITFHLDEAAHSVTIAYRYNMTVAERNARFAERPANTGASDAYAQCGVMCGPGVIYTKIYDTAVAYAIGGAIYTGASGRFTSGAGSTIIIGTCVQIPSTTNSFLGIAIKAPVT